MHRAGIEFERNKSLVLFDILIPAKWIFLIIQIHVYDYEDIRINCGIHFDDLRYARKPRKQIAWKFRQMLTIIHIKIKYIKRLTLSF